MKLLFFGFLLLEIKVCFLLRLIRAKVQKTKVSISINIRPCEHCFSQQARCRWFLIPKLHVPRYGSVVNVYWSIFPAACCCIRCPVLSFTRFKDVALCSKQALCESIVISSDLPRSQKKTKMEVLFCKRCYIYLWSVHKMSMRRNEVFKFSKPNIFLWASDFSG